jgi:shikimate kinase
MSTILERTAKDRARPLLERRDAKGSQDLLRRRLPHYARCADLLINTEGKRPEEIAERIWDEVHHSFSS